MHDGCTYVYVYNYIYVYICMDGWMDCIVFAFAFVLACASVFVCVLYCIVLYCIVLYCTVLYCIVSYCMHACMMYVRTYVRMYATCVCNVMYVYCT